MKKPLKPVRVEKALENAVFPHFPKEVSKLRDGRKKLVHYTSASNALKIIGGKEFWLRKSTLMNDFNELEYGRTLLSRSLENEGGLSLKSLLTSLDPQIFEALEKTLKSDFQVAPNQTYIGSFSLHNPNKEDILGRLSMWRAYGGNNGVAIVFNPGIFLSEQNTLSVISTPVQYLNQRGFDEHLAIIANKMSQAIPTLKKSDYPILESALEMMALNTIVSVKHPGFAEEREWRVFYNKNFDHGESSLIKHEVEDIRGVPQMVVKIPLNAELNPLLSLGTLIDRIIVGPSEYGNAVGEAIAEVLQGAGIDNPTDRISISNIPLRQS